MKRRWILSAVHLAVAGLFLAMIGTISCKEEPGDGTGKKDKESPSGMCG